MRIYFRRRFSKGSVKPELTYGVARLWINPLHCYAISDYWMDSITLLTERIASQKVFVAFWIVSDCFCNLVWFCKRLGSVKPELTCHFDS